MGNQMNSSMTQFMKESINIAQNSGLDVPVGALIVKNNKVIASACNEREKNNDITAHAEIIAIKKAAKKLGNWRFDECELYVTLEPCPMCAWAILQSRIKTVYFGSFDPQYGAFGSALDLRNHASSKLKIYSGILEEECDNLIESFWQKCRNKRNEVIR